MKRLNNKRNDQVALIQDELNRLAVSKCDEETKGLWREVILWELWETTQYLSR